jgi:hypothetical protein
MEFFRSLIECYSIAFMGSSFAPINMEFFGSLIECYCRRSMDMKINKRITVFIISLITIVLIGFFIINYIGINKQVKESQVVGLIIEFENGTTESEVKAILENYNMTVNYSIEYNSNNLGKFYYVVVEENKIKNIRDELKNVETAPYIKKGNYYIIPITELTSQDKTFLTILEKNNLQLKKSVSCYITFGDGSYKFIMGKNCITGSDAAKLINELETNEKILIVSPSDVVG